MCIFYVVILDLGVTTDFVDMVDLAWEEIGFENNSEADG